MSGYEDGAQPALDCLTMGHLIVQNTEPGAWPTEDGSVPWASWCLWCGSGVSNEDLEQSGEVSDG